jgi:S1-C subfamily serine protease
MMSFDKVFKKIVLSFLSLIFIFTLSFAPVLAQSEDTNKGEVLGASNAFLDKSAILTKPAVVHIFSRNCVVIKVSSSVKFPRIAGKEDKICVAGFGTGFFVNENGYIATNAHVSKQNPIDMVVSSSAYPSNTFYKNFTADVGELMLKGSILKSSTGGQSTTTLENFIDLVEKKDITLTPVYESYIEGSEKFSVDSKTLELKNRGEHYKAELIDGSDIDSFNEIYLSQLKGKTDGVRVPDIALLKIRPDGNEKFPSLKLADYKQINIGQPIQAVGFPSAADEQSLFSSEASIIATLTKGTISAIKPNFNDSFKLVQIDASISPGNSGGPIVNQDGEVVGVVTYAVNLKGSADYNAGVSVEELAKLLKKNDIENTSGQVSTLINNGLDNFDKQYYKRAIDDFIKAKELYNPTGDVLEPLIKTAQSKIEKGEDRTPILSAGGLDVQKKTFYISLALFFSIAFIFLMVLIALAIKVHKQHKRK